MLAAIARASTVFGGARDVLEENVPAADQRREHEANLLALAVDDRLDVLQQAARDISAWIRPALALLHPRHRRILIPAVAGISLSPGPEPRSPLPSSGIYDHVVPAWLLWVVAAVALTLGEIATPGLFFLGPIALAACASAIVAAARRRLGDRAVVFVAGSAASLGLLRPIARRHLRMPLAIRTGTRERSSERRRLVVERVDADGGRVKIGGEIWSARAFDAAQVLEPGLQVEVAEIEGATALVYE